MLQDVNFSKQCPNNALETSTHLKFDWPKPKAIQKKVQKGTSLPLVSGAVLIVLEAFFTETIVMESWCRTSLIPFFFSFTPSLCGFVILCQLSGILLVKNQGALCSHHKQQNLNLPFPTNKGQVHETFTFLFSKQRNKMLQKDRNFVAFTITLWIVTPKIIESKLSIYFDCAVL